MTLPSTVVSTLTRGPGAGGVRLPRPASHSRYSGPAWSAEYASDSDSAGVAIDAAADQLEGGSIAAPNVHVSPDVSEYHEAENTGQALEAEFISGVENAPDADVSEVHVSGETAEDNAEPVK